MNNLYINRNLEKEMIEAKKYFPVMTITGPRQSGKTTIIKKVFNELPYLSLEDLDIRAFAINDPRGFLLQNSQGLILDEVQNLHLLLPLKFGQARVKAVILHPLKYMKSK